MDLELLAGTKASDTDVEEVKSKFNPSDTSNLHIDVTPYEEYSTTEHVVGKWIDGKPLYERTISQTVSIGTGWSEVVTLGTSIVIREVRHCALYSWSDNRFLPLPWPTTSSILCLANGTDSTQKLGSFYAKATSAISSKQLIVTFRYTKTTD